MSNPIIHIEGIGKRYRYGGREPLSDSLRGEIANLFKRVAGRGPAKPGAPAKDQSQYFWALQDINFDVQRGDVVGVIGRNGAGKSTLLKILSRITQPTTGQVTYHGHVASLLEVGTGFHRELTGRENVFLNGSILGMRRSEIAKRFDEIVGFAEVEKFIDTPVKFYSSGMYVRLAFAVAAHLNPDILLVDEVLAVGDVNFQKKCLGKMNDVAKHGRTILFVSHNLQAIRTLCSRGLVIEQGRVVTSGPTDDCLRTYTQILNKRTDLSGEQLQNRLNRTSGEVRFKQVVAVDDSGHERWTFATGETLRLYLKVAAFKTVDDLGVYIAISSSLNQDLTITTIKTSVSEKPVRAGDSPTILIELPNILLRPGDYSLYIVLGNRTCEKFYDVVDQNVSLPLLSITSEDKDPHKSLGYFALPFKCDFLEQQADRLPAFLKG